jgi:hypothetical protein
MGRAFGDNRNKGVHPARPHEPLPPRDQTLRSPEKLPPAASCETTFGYHLGTPPAPYARPSPPSSRDANTARQPRCPRHVKSTARQVPHQR